MVGFIQMSFLFKRDIARSIETVWLEVKSVISSKMLETQKTLTSSVEDTVRSQIISLASKNAAIWKMMWTKLIDYMRKVLISNTLPTVPEEYADLRDELRSIAQAFKLLAQYNYDVYGERMLELLQSTELNK